MIHIAPWPVAEGLLTQAAARLRQDGKFFLYGPFKRDGVHTAPSNEAFDHSLRRQDPRWGVRDIEEVESRVQQRPFARAYRADAGQQYDAGVYAGLVMDPRVKPAQVGFSRLAHSRIAHLG